MTKSNRLFLKIVRRKEHIKRDNTAPICLRLTMNRKIRYINLNKYIEEQYWDVVKSRAKRNYHLADPLNLFLADKESKAIRIIYEFDNLDKPVTFTNFEKAFLNESNDDFYEFAKDHIETIRSRVSIGYVNKNYSDMRKLQAYAPELNLSDINLSFLRKFDRYMRETLKNQTNTVSKTMKFLRLITREALKQGNIKEDPFLHYNFESQETQRAYLSMEEIQVLESLLTELKEDKLRNTLKVFLFSCYTGLRYQDAYELRYNQIFANGTNGKVTYFIKLNPHKDRSGSMLRLPLIPQALKLIGEIKASEEKVLRMYSNQKTNDYLKVIMLRAGINKSISFHCARHTFATISLNLGMPLEAVQKLLGHKKIVTTQIYAKMLDETVDKEMERWF